MAEFTQADRPISIETPLGQDVVLLAGFQGHEAISDLFRFQVELLAARETSIAFDAVLGQPVVIRLALAGGGERFFHGIVSRFSAGRRDDTFAHYRAEVVPRLWLLTRRMRCRTFQHLTIPEILKKVLDGLDVKYELTATYHPRDYCAQYRESDFAFASRLMEEEGIYYFFQHSAGGHKMIVTDVPNVHPDLPFQKTVIYEEVSGGVRDEMRITEWMKDQEIRSGKYTLWDHCFELPGKNLEAVQSGLDAVRAGTVNHKLKVAGNDQLEIYDYPGGFAQRFDGIDKGGSARPADLQKIFEDNRRTARIRMEQETVNSLRIEGTSVCGNFIPGYKFDLTRHFDADGSYLLTRVEHTVTLENAYRSGSKESLDYQNRFVCIPGALPYRPLRKTPRPAVEGPQTAVVVGPPGEEIFCDKYGRVKVQFLWDREGKLDVDSSCWIRVNNPWGGKNWGGNFLPHVGQEVIVDFEEGDPDRPIIMGRVYNAECMPPLTLPGHKTKSIIRDQGGNQIFMEGNAGAECIVMNSPCGKTSLSMGYVPAEIAPTGSAGSGVVERMKDLVPFINQGPSFTMFSEGSWNSQFDGNCDDRVQGDRKAFTGGKNQSLTLGPTWAEVRNNYDTLVTGNYTCRVNGYQEYTTRGDYTTNVWGKNFVTIVGLNMNKMLAVQVNMVTGAKLDYEKTKNLKQTPTYQLIVSKDYRKAAKLCQKAASLKEDADRVERGAAIMNHKVKGRCKVKAGKIRHQADELVEKATKILMQGSNVNVDAITAIKKKFKTLNIKDSG